jgi:predicted ATP-grasp superfamily ATP-dependent carboligase
VALYDLHRTVDMDAPVLILGLDGWIDAGAAAAGATAALVSILPNEVIATFDSDALVDHRARRPVARLVDGVNTGITWPVITLRAAQDRVGHDVLLLIGPEPDMKWHAFVADVVGLASQLGVRLAIGLGGFPAPAPHTRPVRLAATATTQELAQQVGFVPGTMDVPAGINAALERGFADAGIPAVGLWARVPHYVANMQYPAASLALVDGLAQLTGVEIDTHELRAATAIAHQRIEALIANSTEHTELVRQLESQTDAEAEAGADPIDQSDLPSGDEIAAELERFLRDQR